MSDRRKALITGASRGIGRAICVKLAVKERILYSVTVQVMRLPVKQLIYAESMELKSMQLRQM